jgi:hypothetical protein
MVWFFVILVCLTRTSSVRGGDNVAVLVVSGGIMTLRFYFIAVVVCRIPGFWPPKVAGAPHGSSSILPPFSLFSEFTVRPPIRAFGKETTLLLTSSPTLESPVRR